MKAICIDDTNKPEKIPTTEWIKEGEVYTIVKIIRMGLQPNKFGVLLKEIELSSNSFPYEFYDAERFLPIDVLSDIYKESKETVKEADLELI
jgi:hypothetical protein